MLIRWAVILVGGTITTSPILMSARSYPIENSGSTPTSTTLTVTIPGHSGSFRPVSSISSVLLIDGTEKELGTPGDKSVNLTQDSGSSNVGLWVGVGFAILIAVLLVVCMFIGHKRVREFFVVVMTRRWRHKTKPGTKVALSPHAPSLILENGEINCSSRSDHPMRISPVKMLRRDFGTPRTMTPEPTLIPTALIEMTSDGRMSPRLPITSKRSPMHIEQSP
jgi:hypothetical protein